MKEGEMINIYSNLVEEKETTPIYQNNNNQTVEYGCDNDTTFS